MTFGQETITAYRQDDMIVIKEQLDVDDKNNSAAHLAPDPDIEDLQASRSATEGEDYYVSHLRPEVEDILPSKPEDAYGSNNSLNSLDISVNKSQPSIFSSPPSHQRKADSTAEAQHLLQEINKALHNVMSEQFQSQTNAQSLIVKGSE